MFSSHLPFALLPSIGGGEMLLVLALILLLFGGDKMPQLAKGLGKAVREFKKAAGDVEQEIKRAIDEVPDTPPKKTVTPPPPAQPAPRRLDPPPGTTPSA